MWPIKVNLPKDVYFYPGRKKLKGLKGVTLHYTKVGHPLNRLTGLAVDGWGVLLEEKSSGTFIIAEGSHHGDLNRSRGDEYWDPEYIRTYHTPQEAYEAYRAYQDNPDNFDLRS